jgi:hypothetical protein
MPVLYYELHQEKDFGRLRTAARYWMCCPYAFFDKCSDITKGEVKCQSNY